MNLLNKKIKNLNIKLASKSPRRQELLRNIIEDFEIVTKDVEEEYPKDLKANEIALYLAKLKANSYLKGSKENELYITADTIVVYENKVLGKPIDSKDEKNEFRILIVSLDLEYNDNHFLIKALNPSFERKSHSNLDHRPI